MELAFFPLGKIEYLHMVLAFEVWNYLSVFNHIRNVDCKWTEFGKREAFHKCHYVVTTYWICLYPFIYISIYPHYIVRVIKQPVPLADRSLGTMRV